MNLKRNNDTEKWLQFVNHINKHISLTYESYIIQARILLKYRFSDYLSPKLR